jgi:hypothetical protein
MMTKMFAIGLPAGNPLFTDENFNRLSFTA